MGVAGVGVDAGSWADRRVMAQEEVTFTGGEMTKTEKSIQRYRLGCREFGDLGSCCPTVVQVRTGDLMYYTDHLVALAEARKEERERCARAALAFDGGGDPPCECCICGEEGLWWEDCDCQNQDDKARVSAWCREMNTRNTIAAACRALGEKK